MEIIIREQNIVKDDWSEFRIYPFIEKGLNNGIITIILLWRVTDSSLFLLILFQSGSECRLFANVANVNVLHSVDNTHAL